jgi:hypothetical protein
LPSFIIAEGGDRRPRPFRFEAAILSRCIGGDLPFRCADRGTLRSAHGGRSIESPVTDITIRHGHRTVRPVGEVDNDQSVDHETTMIDLRALLLFQQPLQVADRSIRRVSPSPRDRIRSSRHGLTLCVCRGGAILGIRELNS